MRKIFVLLSTLSLLFFFVNCPQEENKEPTAEEKASAKKSIAALNVAMQQAYTTGQSNAAPQNPMYATTSYDINKTLDASAWGGSGTITVTGTGSYDDETNKYSMTMTLKFNNYTYAGITINGSCTLTSSGTDDTFSMTYNGSFKVTGEYNMSLSIKENITFTGSTLSYSATITVDGKTWTESQTVNMSY